MTTAIISRSDSMPRQLRLPVDVINRVAPNLIGDARVLTPGIGVVARNEALGASQSNLGSLGSTPSKRCQAEWRAARLRACHRDGSESWCIGSGSVEPDLMRTSRLAMECQAERLQSLDDVPVAEAGARSL